MMNASHDEIVRLFPGIQDHTVLEIQATEASAEDLEVALLLFQDEDEGLIDVKRQKGSRLNQLLEILANSDIRLPDDIEK